MEFHIDLINNILPNTIVAQSELIGDTIFVNSNPASVETTIIKKINSEIVKSTDVKEYRLLNKNFLIHSQDIDDICKKISTSIDESFIDYIDSISIEENVKYFKKGLYKLISKEDPEIIFKNISKKCDWIVTSFKILSKLSKIDGFSYINSDLDSNIELSGKIGNLNIFVKSDIKENYIYEGVCKETTSVFLKEITMSSNLNIYDIEISFAFNSNGIRKIILE